MARRGPGFREDRDSLSAGIASGRQIDSPYRDGRAAREAREVAARIRLEALEEEAARLRRRLGRSRHGRQQGPLILLGTALFSAGILFGAASRPPPAVPVVGVLRAGGAVPLEARPDADPKVLLLQLEHLFGRRKPSSMRDLGEATGVVDAPWAPGAKARPSTPGR
jgi:hypothetical protein